MSQGRVARLIEGVFGHGCYPHQLAFLIDNPLRRLLISPERLADHLALADDARVLELGPGSGFFSVTLAGRLPQGRLELFDLQPEMLVKARRKLTAFPNVGYTAGDARQLPFADASFSRALLVAVLGEVPAPERCLRELERVVAPDGLVVVHEQIPDPDHIPPDRLDRLFTGSGFARVLRDGPGWNYSAVYRRKSVDRST
jgi:ubiquinone/menaquinone biosynthesis C-methylase UbiE